MPMIASEIRITNVVTTTADSPFFSTLFDSKSLF
jgi:hypothetical protein